MKKIGIAVHGGASEDSSFIQQHREEMHRGLSQAVLLGYSVLEKGKSALHAVEIAVKLLEDNPLFNAGKGSALNAQGEVEMDAAIMDGQTLRAGAVAMVREVKNPIGLARLVMEKTKHVLLAGDGAMAFAKTQAVALEQPAYFICEHQVAALKALQKSQKTYGTVGAVALDSAGNLAAATSTGGLTNALPGRIGDSCLVGAGCYASNKTCAVSGTGEGEYLIRGVVAHTIALMLERGMSLEEACKQVIFDRNTLQGEMGVIALNSKGEFGIAFNTEIMKRAWISSSENLQIKI